MKNTEELEEQMERLRVRGLERQTLELLKTTHWGRIYALIYFFIGVGSIFLYAFVFGLGIIISIFFGMVTWLIVSFIVDKILIKTQRIDTQLDWLLKTPEGFAELKRRGMTDEQIEKLKVDMQSDSLYKKFSLENYKK